MAMLTGVVEVAADAGAAAGEPPDLPATKTAAPPAIAASTTHFSGPRRMEPLFGALAEATPFFGSAMY